MAIELHDTEAAAEVMSRLFQPVAAQLASQMQKAWTESQAFTAIQTVVRRSYRESTRLRAVAERLHAAANRTRNAERRGVLRRRAHQAERAAAAYEALALALVVHAELCRGRTSSSVVARRGRPPGPLAVTCAVRSLCEAPGAPNVSPLGGAWAA